MRQETMVYVGLDVHEEFCQACVIDPSGRVLSNERFSSTRDELNEFLDRFEDANFVLESAGIWELIYKGIEKSRIYSVGLPSYSSGSFVASALVWRTTLSWCSGGE